MPTLHLNLIQGFKLFQFLETQGKGAGFMLRMQRLYRLLDIERIEGVFEKNQEVIDRFQADGRPVPRDSLEALRIDDPPRDVEVERGDLEWIARRVKAWTEDSEPALGKAVDAGQATNWRIWLPIVEALDAALKV